MTWSDCKNLAMKVFNGFGLKNRNFRKKVLNGNLKSKKGLAERVVYPKLHLLGGAEWAIEKVLFTPKARSGYIEALEEGLRQLTWSLHGLTSSIEN